eukprot:354033-Chlamydomonas_euryale.AAC.2
MPSLHHTLVAIPCVSSVGRLCVVLPSASQPCFQGYQVGRQLGLRVEGLQTTRSSAVRTSVDRWCGHSGTPGQLPARALCRRCKASTGSRVYMHMCEHVVLKGRRLSACMQRCGLRPLYVRRGESRGAGRLGAE